MVKSISTPLRSFVLYALGIIFIIYSPSHATEFKFADKQTAIEILTADDEYLKNMQPIEIALRVGSKTADKTIDDLKAHYAANVIAWPAAEKAIMKALIVTNKKKIAKIAHLLPDTIYFIKVSSDVEGAIAHTRGNAFVSPVRERTLSTKLFFHQIFHLISRNHRNKRVSLYDIIGFKPCNYQPTEQVEKYSIKNPEAPFSEFYLPVEISDEDSAVMSYLHTDKDGFDPNIKGGYNAHISGDLIEVKVDNGNCVPVVDNAGKPNIYKHDEIEDFYDTVGRNGTYVIHPEEIMADNFSVLMMKIKDVPDPDIPEQLKEWLGY